MHGGVRSWAPFANGPVLALAADAVRERIYAGGSFTTIGIAPRVRWGIAALDSVSGSAIDGWDPRFRTAGDDVDLCWRLQEKGWTLGFSPSALVWHHRRNSIREFWRQQKGYGRAEALLEAKWPERYNRAGHLSWAGRMYGRGLIRPPYLRQRVYHGSWGLGLFQTLYRPSPGTLASLPLMPEWYLLIAVLAGLSALGLLWSPLLAAVPLLVAAVVAVLAQAAKSAAHAAFPAPRRSFLARVALRTLTASLYLMQSFARLWGRLAHGLSPWRMRARPALRHPLPRTLTRWEEYWRSPADRLQAIETTLGEEGTVTRRGGDFDRVPVIPFHRRTTIIRLECFACFPLAV